MYFHPAEFRCRCGCGGCLIDPRLMELLETCRGQYGKPMIVTSGFRCEKHNEAVAGAPSSAHLTGHAADIACGNASDRFMLVKIFSNHFTRIGLAKSFIHVDTHPTNPQNVIWFY